MTQQKLGNNRPVKERLDEYFNEVADIILERQHPATGLVKDDDVSSS
jgi:hypothetical protein